MAMAMQILSGPKHLQKTIVEEPAGQGSAASRRWGRWTCEAPLFANVAEQDHKNESMSWARWGAVKWVQNQPRALAANAYEAGVDEGESFIPVLKFETFWEMVRPCLCKEATKADVDAILKRATFLVNTKQFVYYLSFCFGLRLIILAVSSTAPAVFFAQIIATWQYAFKQGRSF